MNEVKKNIHEIFLFDDTDNHYKKFVTDDVLIDGLSLERHYDNAKLDLITEFNAFLQEKLNSL